MRNAASRLSRTCLSIAGIGLFVSAVIVPSASADSPSPEQAEMLFNAQAWEKAATAYAGIVDGDPDNGLAWFRLGTCHGNLGNWDEAANAWRKADALGVAPRRIKFDLARAEARVGDGDRAIELLDVAVDAGFSDVESLKDDPALESVRHAPMFPALVEAATKNRFPCRYDVRFRQFDFWVGEWDVFTARGRKAGTNTIESNVDGCMLLENWHGAGGSHGMSINYFDPVSGTWKQVWVDRGGGNITLEGKLRDGAMHLSGENRSRDGKTELTRGTWTPLPDGRVRQFFEQSKDDGKTWYTWFDGYYVRRK
jgi:tetratricopeptide (TPR) repeat protein